MCTQNGEERHTEFCARRQAECEKQERKYGDDHKAAVEAMIEAINLVAGLPDAAAGIDSDAFKAKVAEPSEGMKYDGEKLRYDLLPPEAIEAVVEVLTFGANKYADRNWEKGIKYGRLVGALRRHVAAWELGETHDPETGLPHLAHAMCCVMFLLTYELRGMEDWNDMPVPRIGTLVFSSEACSEIKQSEPEGFFGYTYGGCKCGN